jgi:N-dimethylarginine dimethylaminohydrolase
MVEPLRRVIVRRPDAAFAVPNPARWHYTSRPNLEAAQAEHDAFVDLIRQASTEVLYHDGPQPGRADAIFVHDPAIVTDAGAILLRMGKELRRGEEDSLGRRLEELGVPILGRLRGKAMAEGGDLLWLDHDTLVVGQGFRTNAAGFQQVRRMVRELGVSAIPVALPYYSGREACLHLMSLISLVDHDVAVVFPRLLPVPFWELLRDRGIDLIEVPDPEFETMGTNVLALGPRRVIVLAGNPVTVARLRDIGCAVETYSGKEVSLKAEGGPTCLTRPILRRA